MSRKALFVLGAALMLAALPLLYIASAWSTRSPLQFELDRVSRMPDGGLKLHLRVENTTFFPVDLLEATVTDEPMMYPAFSSKFRLLMRGNTLRLDPRQVHVLETDVSFMTLDDLARWPKMTVPYSWTRPSHESWRKLCATLAAYMPSSWKDSLPRHEVLYEIFVSPMPAPSSIREELADAP